MIIIVFPWNSYNRKLYLKEAQQITFCLRRLLPPARLNTFADTGTYIQVIDMKSLDLETLVHCGSSYFSH